MNRRTDQLSRAAERIGAPAHLLRFWATRFRLDDGVRGSEALPAQSVDALGGVKLLLVDAEWTADDVDLMIENAGYSALRDLAPTELTGLAPQEARTGLADRLATLKRARAALAAAGDR